MLRVMIDSNVYDRLVEDPETLERLKELVGSGGWELVTTYVQRREIECTVEQAKRDALQTIQPANVPTSTLVWDVAAWDESDWGDQLESEDFEAILGNATRARNSKDALIGLTAMRRADILVTDDQALAHRLTEVASRKNSTLQVWTFEQLTAHVRDASTQKGGPKGHA